MKIQDAFRQFLKEQFAPKMRSLGFSGSGQRYAFPSDTHHIQIGIQKSAYSDSNELQFTLNFQIIEKNEWIKESASIDKPTKKPNPNVHERIGYTERISLMTPENLDKWWIYGLDTSELTLLDEVFELVETYVSPKIQETLKDQPNQASLTTPDAARPTS